MEQFVHGQTTLAPVDPNFECPGSGLFPVSDTYCLSFYYACFDDYTAYILVLNFVIEIIRNIFLYKFLNIYRRSVQMIWYSIRLPGLVKLTMKSANLAEKKVLASRNERS